jgi:SAM-dependent methyltransferase
MIVDGHLGGYIPGGDPATHYPDLWRWLVEGPEHVESVLDVGCGDGVALRFFRDTLGIDALGIDGIPQDDPDIIEHDYTTGPFVTAIADEDPDRFALVWSCEFVEHVAEEFIGNFLVTFDLGDLVLMTHAEPGQGGWHHVNLQHSGYWIQRMDEIGFELDGKLTNKTRELARLNESAWNHYGRSGLAFRRREEEAVGEHERLRQGESSLREESESQRQEPPAEEQQEAQPQEEVEQDGDQRED